MVTDEWARLGRAPYVSLESFRSDGSAVATPVWIAPDGVGSDRLLVWTRTDSHKVRRIRRDPRVRLAECSVRGKVSGPRHEGRAVVLDLSQNRRVGDRLVSKYGVWARISLLLSRWRRGREATIGIAIKPAE